MDRVSRFAKVWLTVAVSSAALWACFSGDQQQEQPVLTDEQLRDPQTCKQCHAAQFDQWASSMHAYASEDPVFLAMNARGQRETNGALGSFCVQCHAPLALRGGLTTDGSNLASLPAPAKGVTCFFCHTTSSANGANDDPLVLATDGVMRASITTEAPGAPHAGTYSLMHDGHVVASSQLCGTCHDVTNQHGVDVEKTFDEWRHSVFSTLLSANDNTRSCNACHMRPSQGQAASYPLDSPVREIHDHSMAGVDVALVPFPGQDAQRALVQKELDAAVTMRLCVGTGSASVTLTTMNVGHRWPSGAVQDRRAWVELVAKASGQVVFQSGVVADGQSIMTLTDPSLWLLRETMVDDSATEVPFLWQATSISSTAALPPPTALEGAGAQHSVTRTYTLPSAVDDVTARVRLVPIDQMQLDDLVASGDLSADVRNAMPVISLAGATVSWTAGGRACLPY